ncbi:DNA adenine methylase [Sphingomonas sp. ABOLF]|uniref:DNA adenine methylase n=1 Tax=Sphingomonas sp. ABOLF TaxID=1985879 RepID=UPI000657F9F9|nr:DNA adenine methylase [Sphingomonas sp. ABOLF]
MGYLGAKSASGAYQAVIAQMPPHDTYIETHLGSGVVLHRKPPAPRSIGLELDPDTLAAFAAPYPVELHNVDCLAFLRTFDFATAGRVLIYADPPYVLASRTGPDRYRFDYTDADHCELVALLRTLPAMVLLSGYPSALYADLLPDWPSIQFQVMTRGGPRTEQLWRNFALDAAHWATFAGDTFTRRQQIKRKAATWARRYRDLEPGERLAVLAAILAEHA